MVNDTTTLNGALSELGETMAANITTKGVTASASDGLTTLAGKILQISGGGGGGTTVLIDDDCTVDNTSDYGSSIRLTDGQTSTCSLSFNSQQSCYNLSGSGNNISAVTLDALDGLDNIKLRIKFKLGGTSNYYQCILAVAPSKTNNVAFTGIRQMNGNFQDFSDSGGGGGSESTKGSVSNISSQWHYLELIKEDTTLTGTVYDDTLTEIASFTKTISANYKYYLLGMNTEKGYTTYISEIYAETLGSGSDCSQYQTEIANAIEYINGSGS